MSWYNRLKSGGVQKKSASSYWYDEYNTSYDYLDKYSDLDDDKLSAFKKTNDLYKLSATRRAISNFVQIVTQKSIPVTFATKSDSMTDGKRVILSADVDDNFDVSVGLALHEGSHIVLSDFTLLSEMSSITDTIRYLRTNAATQNKDAIENGYPIPYSDDYIDNAILQKIDGLKYKAGFAEMFTKSGKIGSKITINKEIETLVGQLTNWIEDRRIDQYIYNSAPGYRDYYSSMYDHYFNDKMITKGIASDEYTDETIDSYMFRIINLHNEETDLSKLRGLRAIYRLINLSDIQRLKSTEDAFNLSIEVVAEILNHIELPDASGNQKQKGKGESDGETTESEDGDGSGDTNGESNGDGNGSGINMDAGDMEGTPSESDSSQAPAGQAKGDVKGKQSMTGNQKKQLDNKIKKQKEFLDGKVKKKQVSKTEMEKLENISASDTELVRVGNDYNPDGYGHNKGVDCIVVKNLTDKMISDKDFPFSSVDWRSGEPQKWAEDEVRRGITLGTLLGKKLQVRNESRETVYSRLTKGKIDGRMVASLGYDNENVFFTKEVDQYKKANLHISIDYSGSMSGSKIKKAITSTVAIVKACEMARNINVQVSIRSTDSGSRSLPYIAVVYDSRKGNFRTFARYMSILRANNTTPEGLCFEAIQKQLIPSTNDSDSYFLNFSDGEPCYSISNGGDGIQYTGPAAAKHTNKQIKKMQSAGINVLSYFISEYDNVKQTSAWRLFEQCYGRDAKSVNVENMFEVAKTMNEMFLRKS